ncbi:hypothetical protein K5I29_07115 [Flavobacterium agricola]|uniref:Polysaccharide pyruvyl transferase n=1 Tax=Flavobacterium agricola TaxID=2870839 RepID=A0ABY6LZM7_9FLAO|nr:hypothetical protein [Flavobacterium agricola]UYW00343.1 hypothetical protein K5I29_07115 [Flavobacterium agricola]
MKITIISYDNWGLNQTLASELAELGHQVEHIDFHKIRYQYPNIFYRVYNFAAKTFLKKNIKHVFYGKQILKKLGNAPKQDLIITIKGDFIDCKSLKAFKKHTTHSVGFFNDSATRCPRIKKAGTCFDVTFSFDPEDCKQFGFYFLPNWIYTSPCKVKSYKYVIFNICSAGKRVKFIDKLAAQFKALQLPYKLLVFDSKKRKSYKNIEVITKKLSLDQVEELEKQAQILLDIAREKQMGLSFRIFESLGYQKKIITTNKDIVNYDFYNPQNCLILNEDLIEIDKQFFETDYVPLSPNIYEKYTVKGWFKTLCQNL